MIPWLLALNAALLCVLIYQVHRLRSEARSRLWQMLDMVMREKDQPKR